MRGDLAVLIMAAGQASRFRGCKLLQNSGGISLLQHCLNNANHISPGHCYIVSGAWHDRIKRSLDNTVSPGVEIIFNPDWQKGIGNSIARGVKFVSPGYNAILILLADQIALTACDLENLLSRSKGNDIACAKYQGTRGVPAVFGQIAFADLTLLDSDKGAKPLLYDPKYSVAECPMDLAAVDIDTPADLRLWNFRALKVKRE